MILSDKDIKISAEREKAYFSTETQWRPNRASFNRFKIKPDIQSL